MNRNGNKCKIQDKIYIVCLNPNCCQKNQRCLTSKTLHFHPQECSKYFYPTQTLIQTYWQQLDNYPNDVLGCAVKQKCKQQPFLHKLFDKIRSRVTKILDDCQIELTKLYSAQEINLNYHRVYELVKIANALKKGQNPSYISEILNYNFNRIDINALTIMNEDLDEISLTLQRIYSNMKQGLLSMQKKYLREFQSSKSGEMNSFKKINNSIQYKLIPSKFIASTHIYCNQNQISFPRLPKIAHFLPWVYSSVSFNQGQHQLAIKSCQYPIIQNCGFTILQEHDLDTYPYNIYHSLYSHQGKGFQLVQGEPLQKFIDQQTIVTLRLCFDTQPSAIITDSDCRCMYRSQLKPRCYYRLGVYGCGWSICVLCLK